MPIALVVGLGGFLGAMARYGITSILPHRQGELFPIGTLIVNALGSFLLGLLMAWVQRHPEMSATTRLFLSAGILGSFTTFSTLAFECVSLTESGRVGGALVCLGTNLLFGFGAIALGALAYQRLLN